MSHCGGGDGKGEELRGGGEDEFQNVFHPEGKSTGLKRKEVQIRQKCKKEFTINKCQQGT